ncbi:glycosyltransferase family 39 protein [Arthrobacter sp. Alg241-R88]|uniref:glycosyltransferase family 39 protein n=1 Tax=Arthrobacter sp. Alg241-R88 TaxID=2305984 RepID=UPI001F072223|nr:glycosyltransferase family 39 protein [Arthrobacter sp. Alg241-R88]
MSAVLDGPAAKETERLGGLGVGREEDLTPTHHLLSLVRRFWRGPEQDERWERPSLLAFLAGTAVLFLWGLDANGWANPYYSAAAQAGSQDWTAFFFGSFEWGNLITVDKTPLSIWVMSLSVRLFGLSSWSILVPQALMGVTTSYLVYKIIRRGFGPRTALFGAAVYATTPVVVLMSRFNNPEPLMGLLTVACVLLTLKAMESGRLKNFALAGVLLGLAFMAKQVQALLVVPALGAAVLAFSHGQFSRRLIQLIIAAGTLIATSLAWLVTVDLIPASQRPYIGGSATNSAIELTMDYNGLARFVEIPMNAEGGRASDGQNDAIPYAGGLPRLFNANFAQEIVWLLFVAMVCAFAIAVLFHSLDLASEQRAVAAVSVLWFGSVLSVLCFMGTMIHTYYTYSLAAPLALVVAVGLSCLWQLRHRGAMRVFGATLLVASAYMVLRIMEYSDEWPFWARVSVVFTGAAGAALWLVPALSVKMPRVTSVVLLISLLSAPTAANLFTIGTARTGTNPMSGPVGNDPHSLSRLMVALREGEIPWARQTALGAPPSATVTELLRTGTSNQDWAAATYSAQNAALYQLDSGRAIIPLGGWLGSDPAPTLEQFKALVSERRIGYFIRQQDLLDRGGLSLHTVAISDWVDQHFVKQVIDGVTLYDLRE